MAVHRHFLGWDATIVDKVRAFLIPAPPEGPVDLRNTLIVVPTRQSQRRLREALALYCSRNGAYMLAPSLRTPAHLVLPDGASFTAGALDILAAWAEILNTIDIAQFSGLFPGGAPRKSFAWALSTGVMLQSLRDDLAAHGMSIESVVNTHGQAIHELERWQDLMRLERLFITLIEARSGLQDPCLATLRHVQEPALPRSVERIVLACTPDPIPAALDVLENLSMRVDIDILIHAPADMAEGFDRWGRPHAGWWLNQVVDIAPGDLKLASSPAAQARLAAATMIESGLRSSDVAFGVPDNTVVSRLEITLSESGLPSYDPSGAPVSSHPVYRLLQRYRDLSSQESYAALSALLRNADVLDHLYRVHRIRTSALLTELDAFQNIHLPVHARDVYDHLQEDESQAGRYPALFAATQVLQSLITSGPYTTPEELLRGFLQKVYATRELQPGIIEDDEFRSVASTIDEALHGLSGGISSLLHLTASEAMELLLHHLAHLRHPVMRPQGAVDLEGWLELAWNDAPLIVVTGMNEGSVPGNAGNEAFLPESLRTALGLRTEADRLARDIYLTQTLTACRRHNGRVCFISGKYGEDGEPLRPSRVLFRCTDAELAQRAQRLFGPPDDVRPSVPASVSFRLQPSAPLERDPSIAMPEVLAVTAFRDYLNCPFRFYLKRILGMEPVTDTKSEMDALDIGSLVHAALASLAADAEMRACTSATLLRRYLHDSADRWARCRFGTHPALHLKMQLDVVRGRLSAAAEVQAYESSLGWEIIVFEESFTLACGGMTARGRIDRVDRHRDSGMIRVLDYKTAENARPPHELHFGPYRKDCRDYSRINLGNRERRWTDLQLPLYVLMLRSHFGPETTIQAGYFNLPRESEATGISLWEGLTGHVLESAAACATGVAEDIRARRFWPPAEKVDFDDFESLFPVGAAASVDGDGFSTFLEGWNP